MYSASERYLHIIFIMTLIFYLHGREFRTRQARTCHANIVLSAACILKEQPAPHLYLF